MVLVLQHLIVGIGPWLSLVSNLCFDEVKLCFIDNIAWVLPLSRRELRSFGGKEGVLIRIGWESKDEQRK